jgi:hypothetical protein
LCETAGLVKLGHVALDGTKIKANASKHKAMSYVRIPAIVTTRSDGSRPPVPIDRDQFDGPLGAFSDLSVCARRQERPEG